MRTHYGCMFYIWGIVYVSQTLLCCAELRKQLYHWVVSSWQSVGLWWNRFLLLCFIHLSTDRIQYISLTQLKSSNIYHLMVLSTHKKPFPSKNSLLWSPIWVTMAWERRFSLPSCYYVKDVGIWAHADNTQAHIVLQNSSYWKVSKTVQLFVLFCF